jgi:exosortase A
LKVSIFCLIVYSLLIVLSYIDVFDWMLGRYLGSDTYYSHGFLVPFVSGYLIWLKRNEFNKLQSRTSWIGFALVIIAAIMHLFGTAVYIFFVSGFSAWLLLVSSCLYINGWEKSRLLWFPFVFLLFMLPAPLALIDIISLPMKVFVAHYGVKLSELFGVPVYREGFAIIIPQGTLLVDNPCSGLRSILAFLAIGSLFAYMSNLSINKKWILFLFALPVALLSNLVRVFVLILCSYKFGLAAAAPDTFLHTGSGVILFLLGGTLLYIAMFFLGGLRES